VGCRDRCNGGNGGPGDLVEPVRPAACRCWVLSVVGGNVITAIYSTSLPPRRNRSVEATSGRGLSTSAHSGNRPRSRVDAVDRAIIFAVDGRCRSSVRCEARGAAPGDGPQDGSAVGPGEMKRAVARVSREEPSTPVTCETTARQPGVERGLRSGYLDPGSNSPDEPGSCGFKRSSAC
jgi:hypothetical protein